MYRSDLYWVHPTSSFPPAAFFLDLQQAANFSLSPRQIHTCWIIYHNARHKLDESYDHKIMIMGSLTNTHEATVLANFGTTAKGKENTYALAPIKEAMEKGRISLSTEKLIDYKEGGILSDRDWLLFANDAWILGTLHGGHEVVMIVNEDFDENYAAVLWDTANNRPRVTAREIIGLTHFGFRPIRTGNQCNFVAPTEQQPKILARTRNADFPEYQRIMQAPHTVESIRNLIKPFFQSYQSRAATPLRNTVSPISRSVRSRRASNNVLIRHASAAELHSSQILK